MLDILQALSTYMHNSNNLIIIYTSLFKCCFCYLISYYKANMISINYSIMLKARKTIAESCSVWPWHTFADKLPVTWSLKTRGQESSKKRRFLGNHKSFYVLEGSFHFPSLFLESTISIN